MLILGISEVLEFKCSNSQLKKLVLLNKQSKNFSTLMPSLMSKSLKPQLQELTSRTTLSISLVEISKLLESLPTIRDQMWSELSTKLKIEELIQLQTPDSGLLLLEVKTTLIGLKNKPRIKVLMQKTSLISYLKEPPPQMMPHQTQESMEMVTALTKKTLHQTTQKYKLSLPLTKGKKRRRAMKRRKKNESII